MSVCNLDHGGIQLIVSNVPNIEKQWKYNSSQQWY